VFASSLNKTHKAEAPFFLLHKKKINFPKYFSFRKNRRNKSESLSNQTKQVAVSQTLERKTEAT
jgi:hypothetical protein